MEEGVEKIWVVYLEVEKGILGRSCWERGMRLGILEREYRDWRPWERFEMRDWIWVWGYLFRSLRTLPRDAPQIKRDPLFFSQNQERTKPKLRFPPALFRWRWVVDGGGRRVFSMVDNYSWLSKMVAEGGQSYMEGFWWIHCGNMKGLGIKINRHARVF